MRVNVKASSLIESLDDLYVEDENRFFPKLSDLALREVLLSLRDAKEIDFSLLPMYLYDSLLDRMKAHNLITKQNFSALFRAQAQNFVLSGFNAYVDSDFIKGVDLDACLGDQIHSVGLYNCANLTIQNVRDIVTRVPCCKVLNLGRLRCLSDEFCLEIPKLTPSLESLVLNRNPQLSSRAISELHHIKSLTELSLFNCTGMHDPMQHISKIKTLEVVQLSKLFLNEEDLLTLSRSCPNLKSLTLQKQDLGTNGLKETFSNLKNIRHVDYFPVCSDWKVFNEVLECLPDHIESVALPIPKEMRKKFFTPYLKRVNFKGPFFEEPLSADLIENAPNLEVISVLRPWNGVAFTNQALMSLLTKCEYLKEIYCSGSFLDPLILEGLKANSLRHLEIAEMADCISLTEKAVSTFVQAAPNLRQLNLNKVQAVEKKSTRDDILLSCNKLRSVSLSNCHCWGAKLTRSFYTIQVLNCSESPLTIVGLVSLLKHLPFLATLDVSRTLVGKEASNVIADFSVLRPCLLSSLAIDYNDQNTSECLRKLLPYTPSLSHFSAQGIHRCGSIFHLLPQTVLSVNVAKCNISGTALIKLTKGCPKLTILNLAHSVALNDVCVSVAISNLLQSLTVLHLTGCKEISDASIKPFLENEEIPLEFLHASNTKITKPALMMLKKRIPYLNCSPEVSVDLPEKEMNDHGFPAVVDPESNNVVIRLPLPENVVKKGIKVMFKSRSIYVKYDLADIPILDADCPAIMPEDCLWYIDISDGKRFLVLEIVRQDDKSEWEMNK